MSSEFAPGFEKYPWLYSFAPSLKNSDFWLEALKDPLFTFLPNVAFSFGLSVLWFVIEIPGVV